MNNTFEEVKGREPGASMMSGKSSDDYDSFDGEASQIGTVDLDTLAKVDSNRGNGKQSRITSSRHLGQIRGAVETPPPK